MRRIAVCVVLLFATLGHSPLNAQLKGRAKVDSMLKEIPGQREDTVKVRLLAEISREYIAGNPDEGIKYGQQALTLANRLGWQKGMGKANSFIGLNYQKKYDYATALKYLFASLKIMEEGKEKRILSGVLADIANTYYYMQDNPNALLYYSKYLKISEELGNKSSIASSLTSLANVYDDMGDYPKALEYYNRGLKLGLDIGDKEAIANNTYCIGGICVEQGNYPKGLQFLQKAVGLYEAAGDKPGMGNAYGSLGSFYGKQDDRAKAVEYHMKAIAVYEAIGDKAGVARTYSNIGNLYNNILECDIAVEYFNKALKIFEEIGSKGGIALVSGNIAPALAMQKNYLMAIACGERAVSINRELGNKRQEAFALGALGATYMFLFQDTTKRINVGLTSAELGKGTYKPNVHLPSGKAALLRLSIDYYNKALVLSRELNTLDLSEECYSDLIEAYSRAGDYKKALEASDNYHAIKDSVFSQENKEEILKMGMKNEYDRQRLTDSLKVAEKQKIASINLRKQKSYTYLGIAGILLLAGFSFFIVKERGKSEIARKQSDELLLNILPEEVAYELKTTGTTTARHFDNVTVLFTDFVNFTQAGESMSPQNLIDELHACFRAFDEIAEKYGIEKIKTIGDAYLAVAGLPTADPKHAENIVKAAKEITAFMEDRLGKMGVERTFAVRVGVHSGSVVAGIVGVKKFAYDIWGDTVNTAARMEQNSEAGKINISETTYNLVKDKFNCAYRGEVEVKGKGSMKMYFASSAEAFSA